MLPDGIEGAFIDKLLRDTGQGRVDRAALLGSEFGDFVRLGSERKDGGKRLVESRDKCVDAGGKGSIELSLLGGSEGQGVDLAASAGSTGATIGRVAMFIVMIRPRRWRQGVEEDVKVPCDPAERSDGGAIELHDVVGKIAHHVAELRD